MSPSKGYLRSRVAARLLDGCFSPVLDAFFSVFSLSSPSWRRESGQRSDPYIVSSSTRIRIPSPTRVSTRLGPYAVAARPADQPYHIACTKFGSMRTWLPDTPHAVISCRKREGAEKSQRFRVMASHRCSMVARGRNPPRTFPPTPHCLNSPRLGPQTAADLGLGSRHGLRTIG